LTLLDLIRKAAGPADDLLQFLNMVGQRFPDLDPAARELLAKLTAAVEIQSLTALASALPAEIANIAQGKLDGRRHPSDLV